MASSVAALDHAAFGAIIQRVFRERTSTMVDEARPYSVAELHDSLTSSRRAMRALLETLPETAFEPQPAIGDEPCWSAGQIVVHTVEYQVNTFLRAARLAVGLVPGPEAPGIRTTPRYRRFLVPKHWPCLTWATVTWRLFLTNSPPEPMLQPHAKTNSSTQLATRTCCCSTPCTTMTTWRSCASWLGSKAVEQ
jgi:hypothetical protein